MTDRIPSPLPFLLAALLVAATASTAGAHPIIKAEVSAAAGGTFTDDPANPQITITIPAGALTADAKLRVKLDRHPKPVGELQTGASPGFKIRLTRAEGDDDEADRDRDDEDDDDIPLALTQPMKIAIAADPAPVHPQLGEIAVHQRGGWQRMMVHLYRPSDATVVTLTKRTRGEFRVVHRTLQARTGPAVKRGRDLYFNETWTSESFWGGVFGLHELLNNVDPATAVALGAQVDITKVPQPIVEVMLSDDFGAERGMELFAGRANCVACHSTPEGTGREGEYFTNITASPPEGLLAIAIKVPGLRGLMHTAPYFHDGSAATLAASSSKVSASAWPT